MKKYLLPIIFLAFFSVNSFGQTKRALIIAIGNYPNPPKNGWTELSSLNDVPLVQTALEKQNFKKDNIWKLLDNQATKAGIEKELDRLIDSVKAGDIVVIHVSSHGEQIEDDNVNEEKDGLDECIVPYGAIWSPDKSVFNKIQSGYLRDDVFGEKITKLRNKLGSKGDILVTLDACHSGSGTRGGGTAKSRGSQAPLVSPNFTKKVGVKDPAGVFKDNNGTTLNKDAATYVVISGAQAQEKNFECLDDEGNQVGSLSYALSTAMTTLDGTITYRTLFAQIEDVMREKAPQQKPVLEGDGIDRELFGGKYLRQLPYLPIDWAHSNKDTIYLNSGTVAGVTPNSTIGFYPSGTADPNGIDPILKGKVVIATNFTAAVKLDKENEDFMKKAPWAFMLEMSYGTAPIRVGVDSLDEKSSKQVKDALKEYKLSEITPNCELYFGASSTGDGYALKYANSGTIFQDNIDITKEKQIKDVLKRYDRFRYLRDLKFSEKGLSAKVELVFLDARKKVDLAKMKARTKFGRLELQKDDTVYLKIKNTGDKKLYVNIVDIQPDGIINRVLPNRKLTNIKGLPAPILPENCYVEKRDSMMNTDMMIIISEPYGEEIFKVFLSTQQLDLEDILAGNSDENSRNRGGVLNNLAKIFKSSEVNSAGSRGANPTINTTQDGTIFSLNFAINPKKE